MKLFIEPELDVSRFDIADIISTSDTGDIQKPGDIDNAIGWG